MRESLKVKGCTSLALGPWLKLAGVGSGWNLGAKASTVMMRQETAKRLPKVISATIHLIFMKIVLVYSFAWFHGVVRLPAISNTLLTWTSWAGD